MTALHVVDADQLHYTDIGIALARESMPVVNRTAGKTGLYPGLGAEALLVELIDYLADRRETFEAYCTARARDLDDQPLAAEHVPTSWLEADNAPERVLRASLSDLIDECAKVPPELRDKVISPLLAWAEATALDYPLIDVMKSSIAEARPAVEVEMPLDGVKAGDEFDWPDTEPPELDGRHVRVVGFGREPGTVRLVALGPWQKDPEERETIGGSGATSTFMGGSAGPDAGPDF